MNRLSSTLLVTISILYFLGIFMVYETSSAEVLSVESPTATFGFLIKHLLYGAIGASMGFLLYKLGPDSIYRALPYLFIFTTLMLCLVFIDPFQMRINGASRWLSIFGYSFQPSELAKSVIPLAFICFSDKYNNAFSSKRFYAILLALSLPLFLILIEPDNGTFAIIITTLLVLLFISGIKSRYWILPLCCCFIGITFCVSRMPHVNQRIAHYLHPKKDILGKGHQPYQAKIAVGSGGALGKGFGQSLQKYHYLPEARSDYIAAIYAEETGFLGIVALVCLYVGILFSGSMIAQRAPNEKLFYIAFVCTFLISFGAFLNLGIVCGLLPSKGTNLPFFSQGGSSLCIHGMYLGILLAISEKSTENKKLL